MKLLRFVARPMESSPDFTEFEGAYVNCWVSTRSLAEAKRISRKSIRDAGWLIEELEAVTEVERSESKERRSPPTTWQPRRNGRSQFICGGVLVRPSGRRFEVAPRRSAIEPR